jgi:hypothetical protein
LDLSQESSISLPLMTGTSIMLRSAILCVLYMGQLPVTAIKLRDDQMSFNTCNRVDARKLTPQTLHELSEPTILEHFLEGDPSIWDRSHFRTSGQYGNLMLYAAKENHGENALVSDIKLQNYYADTLHHVTGGATFPLDEILRQPQPSTVNILIGPDTHSLTNFNKFKEGVEFYREHFPFVANLLNETRVKSLALSTFGPVFDGIMMASRGQTHPVHSHGTSLFIGVTGRKGWTFANEDTFGIPDSHQGPERLEITGTDLCNAFDASNNTGWREARLKQQARFPQGKFLYCEQGAGEAIFWPGACGRAQGQCGWWHGTCALDEWVTGITYAGPDSVPITFEQEQKDAAFRGLQSHRDHVAQHGNVWPDSAFTWALLGGHLDLAEELAGLVPEALRPSLECVGLKSVPDVAEAKASNRSICRDEELRSYVEPPTCNMGCGFVQDVLAKPRTFEEKVQCLRDAGFALKNFDSTFPARSRTCSCKGSCAK